MRKWWKVFCNLYLMDPTVTSEEYAILFTKYVKRNMSPENNKFITADFLKK